MATNNQSTQKVSVRSGIGKMVHCHELPKQKEDFYTKSIRHGN